MTTIFEMMQHADGKLQNPVIEYPLDQFNGKIRFSLASKRKLPDFQNYIYITNVSIARAGGPLYLGKVTKDGQLSFVYDCPPALKDIVRRIYSDPLEAVKEAGRRTGRCCFCAQKLTHPSSIVAGYGPTCAEKYGLPWG